MRTRIITALVGITLMIPVFWYSDTYLLPTAMALLCVVGNFELMRCIGVHKKYALAVPQYVIAAAMPFLMRLGGTSTDYFEAAVFIHVAFMCYMLALAVFSHGVEAHALVAHLAVGGDVQKPHRGGGKQVTGKIDVVHPHAHFGRIRHKKPPNGLLPLTLARLPPAVQCRALACDRFAMIK